ncbi:MAP3K12-binding inhibitory protein 1-like isoform X2 [Halichondria panicea]|uniref:MAP3K12-binding inhibitory protein 1-like isoform X2 n=1 Tax=Halichondria panicea TaxID=6063 RepID=UPI00312B8B8C
MLAMETSMQTDEVMDPEAVRLEDMSLTCPEVVIKHDGESVVSVATQTSDHSDQVQINVPLEELLKRVEAFTQLKRRQIDASNQIEFCCCSNPDTSCARTDAAYVKRSPHQVSHIPSTKVHNTTGPTPKALPPLEQLKQDLQPSVSPWIRASLMRGGPSAGGLLGLTERVGNMEQYTHLYEGGDTPRDMVQRVHNLESRLLQLEGRSLEYQHTSGPMALKKVPSNTRTRPGHLRKPVQHLRVT